jgi:redox-sensing transcriptional repressor
MKKLPVKVVERLSMYRRILLAAHREGRMSIFSHELAEAARVTPEQLRRDIMNLSVAGNPSRGYNINELIADITAVMDDPLIQNIALVGIGHLGRAVLAYFMGRRPFLKMTAAFDVDPEKTGRVISGCRSYDMGELEKVIRKESISVALLAVPEKEAHDTAARLVRAGVKAIVNFSPVPLRVPDYVHVEDVDISMAVEKAAYFAKHKISKAAATEEA